MGTSRKGKTGTGTYEYVLSNGYVATRMGNNDFYIFMADGRTDTGFDFPTLKECRSWADQQGMKERSEAMARRHDLNTAW